MAGMTSDLIKDALTKVGLLKYYPLFVDKTIPLDVFENMNREDMRTVGIFDKKDQNTLLEFLIKNQEHFNENQFHQLPTLDIENILQDASLELSRLSINIQLIKRKLSKDPQKYYDSIITANTSSSSAIFNFIHLAQSELHHMQHDYLMKMLKEYQPKEEKFNSPRYIIISVAISCILFGFIIKRFYKIS